MRQRLMAGCAAAACALALLAGCSAPSQEPPATAPTTGEEASVVDTMTATLNDAQVTIELKDNDTARALAARLPFSLSLGELNGNEKYAYLDASLPSNATRPGRVEKGDVMLFGNDCLVIFYESFDTSYSYTRIGRITDPDALDGIAGAPSVDAQFAEQG